MELCEPLREFQKTWPAVFKGTQLTKMTGGGYNWRTLQNEKCRGDAPADIFLRSGSRDLLVVRDAFLKHWQRKLKGGRRVSRR